MRWYEAKIKKLGHLPSPFPFSGFHKITWTPTLLQQLLCRHMYLTSRRISQCTTMLRSVLLSQHGGGTEKNRLVTTTGDELWCAS
ncbi:hypothetical protein ANANG_G00202090 [Anguilla anguilla]|uniref:Uncharacterized protein n=1 Tax=Anguilla anguilla TaxID=7936 RepID=A0A9D3M5M6_ANGAN|nr:hypothetical protein ANANG_G00202090 [Anguilla anguilla]